jgi:hypothetical protein
MNDPKKNSDRAIQRFLEDLRSGADRRSWDDRRAEERRRIPVRMEHDRRCLTDRRAEERRDDPERREHHFFMFTERETMEIHEMLADPDALVACPRCGGPLLLTGPHRSDSGFVRDIICTGCRGRIEVSDPGAAD